MNYTIIKGIFHVAGYSPDGDSIRFEADNPALWDQFNWSTDKSRKALRKQLRFEGIDALETHYEESHQPRAFGLAALEIMLGMLGITGIKYNLAVTNITEAKDQTRGCLAVLGLDRFDRPISLVFAGNVPPADGASIPFSAPLMKKCVNLQLLKMGLAYPTLYDTTPADLSALFANESKKARKSKTGLWALDRTKDFQFLNTATIVNDVVILPKLFRRLTTFLLNASDFSELGDYLKKGGDTIIMRTTGEKTSLAKLVQISDRRIQLPIDPEELLFEG